MVPYPVKLLASWSASRSSHDLDQKLPKRSNPLERYCQWSGIVLSVADAMQCFPLGTAPAVAVVERHSWQLCEPRVPRIKA